MSLKFASPTKLVPVLTKPVSGSTPPLARKNDSVTDMTIGMPATRNSTSKVGVSSNAANAPWPSENAFFFRLVMGAERSAVVTAMAPPERDWPAGVALNTEVSVPRQRHYLVMPYLTRAVSFVWRSSIAAFGAVVPLRALYAASWMARVTSPYFTAFGRDCAPSIDAFRTVRYANLLVRSASVYSAVHVGALEFANRLAFWVSALLYHFSNASAVPLFCDYFETPRLWPRRVDTPGPFRPGIGATPNLSTTFDEPSVFWASVYTYAQLRRKTRLPFWNAVRDSSSFHVSAAFGMVPSLNASTAHCTPATALSVFTVGVPSAARNAPPAELTISAKLQVRPSYFWN